MTDTIRTISVPQSETARDTTVSYLITAPGVSLPEPHHSVPARFASQGISRPPILNRVRGPVVKLANTAYELHRYFNGATVSLRHGNMVGEKLYAVSIFPERCVEFGFAPTWHSFLAFVCLNLDLLAKQWHAFGSWFDSARSLHVFDVVLCVRGEQTALELGRMFHQQSVFGLAAFRNIPINGTQVPACLTDSEASFRDNPDRQETEAFIR